MKLGELRTRKLIYSELYENYHDARNVYEFLSKKDSDSKLPENIVEGWQNIDITKQEIDKHLNRFQEE